MSAGIGFLGLSYLLESGGSGYFPIRVVRSYIEAGRLHLVKEAPDFHRPAYAVYPQSSAQESLLKVAFQGLRNLATAEAATSDDAA